MRLAFFLWFAPYWFPLFDDRPPGQIFVHIMIRIVVLGVLIGLVLVGRKLVQRRQKHTSAREENIE